MRYVNTITGAVLDLQGLRAAFPNTSIPNEGPNRDFLLENDHDFLNETMPPAAGAYQIAYEDGAVQQSDGLWYLNWALRAMTSNEQADWDMSVMMQVEFYRDSLTDSAIEYEKDTVIYQVNNDFDTRARLALYLRGFELLEEENHDDDYTIVMNTLNLGAVEVKADVVGGLSLAGFKWEQKCMKAFIYVMAQHAITPYMDDSWVSDFNDYMAQEES